MRSLMFGWEFPPHHNGGLGVACEGIVNGLNDHGVQVHLVLPDGSASEASQQQVHDKLEITRLPAELVPYSVPGSNGGRNLYGDGMFREVDRYAAHAGEIARTVEHDVIHAHDWMTYPAAIQARRVSGKPFIAHLHAMEHDRTGDNPHPLIAEIEARGLHEADKVIAVSEFTKGKIVEHYRIDPGKVVVVHNAVTRKFSQEHTSDFAGERKYVLYLGRITLQKGPEYFLRAAQKVLTVEPDTNFLMAGEGDMLPEALRLSIELGIERHIFFSGFLRGKDIDRAFREARAFVMPSVAEPFGIAALEAIQHGVPVIVSKNAGVSEVIRSMLRVDFWDVDAMANAIVMALRHQPLHGTLSTGASRELDHLTWKRQGGRIKDVYSDIS